MYFRCKYTLEYGPPRKLGLVEHVYIYDYLKTILEHWEKKSQLK